MRTTTPGRRDAARPTRRHALRPMPEALEDRKLLYATMGGQWALPSRITISIVPDGTSVGGTPSNLNQTLNADANAPKWVAAVVRAFDVWEQVTGVNFVPVPDNGVAIGSGPDQQGDPGHGDIRIAGVPTSPSTLAFAFAPPPINGGDLAGDIVFNTAEPWTTTGYTYDLETVAIHEIGHALGLGHSAIAQADMYAYYTYSKQSLYADDVNGIQSLYGPQPTDVYANTPQNAYNVTGGLNAQGQYTSPVMPGPMLTQQYNNGDWFYVQAPANTSGTLTIAMQATGFSLLQPEIDVENAAQNHLLGRAYSTAEGATTTLTLTGVTPGEGFYIRAGSAWYLPGRGAYVLQLNFGSSTQPAAVPAAPSIAAQPSQAYGTWSGESTGGGLGGLGGLTGGLLGGVDQLVFGSLIGWGDKLTTQAGPHPAGPRHATAGASGHHPAGHHPFAPHAMKHHGGPRHA